MGDILDNKPVFTIVMGCDGCGKTAWKRANRDALADIHIDFDSIADGIGNWDSQLSRLLALRHGELAIAQAISHGKSYGVESTYSGERGVNQVNEALEHGYRIQGHYLGTNSPEINIVRIEQRVQSRTGHYVDPEIIPSQWRYSLSNLRKTAELFDELTIYDNSGEYDLGCQDPPRLAFFERGKLSRVIAEESRPEWFKNWFSGWQHRRAEMERQERKRQRSK